MAVIFSSKHFCDLNWTLNGHPLPNKRLLSYIIGQGCWTQRGHPQPGTWLSYIMGQSYWTQNGHQQPDRGYHTHGSRLLNPARTYTAWKVVNIQSQGYWTQNGHTQSNRWLSYIMGQGYWTQHGRPQPDKRLSYIWDKVTEPNMDIHSLTGCYHT